MAGIFRCVWVVLLLFCSSAGFCQRAAESPSTYYPGQLLVALHPGFTPAALMNALPAFRINIIENLSADWNIWRVSFDGSLDAEYVKSVVSKTRGVSLAQFNHNYIPLKFTPGDTLFGSQWDMSVISAPASWDIVTGGKTTDSQQVVIATIDGGFDLMHPDINYWKNTAEIPGNGIDDDGNGYIDDCKGWNSILASDSIPPLNHGTFVAGISGAIGNNVAGVSGVCMHAKEMVVVTNENNEASVVSAYAYVFRQRKIYNQSNGASGAFVVVTNSSFGPAGYGYDYPLWNAMYDSMGSIGILSAGATSNDPSCNTDTCPDIPSQCASNYTIITTGTTSADVRHGGYGPVNVDIAAPGNGSYTTLWGGAYGSCGGTSAASPHVAGAIALMWSAACHKMLADYKASPGPMALLMKQYLLQSVDTLPALTGLVVSNGRLNVYKAVQRVLDYDCSSASVAAIAPAKEINIFPNPAKDEVSVINLHENTSIRIMDMLGRVVFSESVAPPAAKLHLGNLVPGSYIIIFNNSVYKLLEKQ